MNRRVFLGAAAAGAAGRRLPNVIFILADDLGYGDVSCYNPASRIRTPNIDRLAGQGVRFSDAHSPSGVCSPTRYGLLTGRYAWRTWLKRGVLMGFSPPMIDPDRLTVAGLLRQQGYRTACVGKWHVGMTFTKKDGQKVTAADGTIRDGGLIDFSQAIGGAPVDRGFDYFFGASACPATDYLYSYIEGNRTVGTPSIKAPGGLYEQGNPMSDYRPGLKSPGYDLETVDLVFKDKSVGFIEDHARRSPGRPFFLYHALSAPHKPILPARQFRGTTAGGLYGDFVAEADWAVGEIVKTVDRLGLSRDTLIMFASDNGPEVCVREVRQQFGHNSAGPWRGLKRDNWEAGHRVPFVARWPGRIRPGRTRSEPVCLTDLMATAAAISGARLPRNAGEDSYNILPALLGERLKRPIREALVHHSSEGQFAIRQGDWKLLLHQGAGSRNYPGLAGAPDDAPAQLYNLKSDPEEARNVYREHREVVSRLTGLLTKYQQEGRSAP